MKLFIIYYLSLINYHLSLIKEEGRFVEEFLTYGRIIFAASFNSEINNYDYDKFLNLKNE